VLRQALLGVRAAPLQEPRAAAPAAAAVLLSIGARDGPVVGFLVVNQAESAEQADSGAQEVERNTYQGPVADGCGAMGAGSGSSSTGSQASPKRSADGNSSSSSSPCPPPPHHHVPARHQRAAAAAAAAAAGSRGVLGRGAQPLSPAV
jgi:hypothetical protein